MGGKFVYFGLVLRKCCQAEYAFCYWELGKIMFLVGIYTHGGTGLARLQGKIYDVLNIDELD